MSTAVIFLKERRYHDNYLLVVSELAKYILQPYEETQNQELDKSTVTTCPTGMLYIFSQPSFLVC